MLGVQGIVIMWQLVFALCHRLKSNNNKKNKNKKKKKKKGCQVVMANPSNLGHGKNISGDTDTVTPGNKNTNTSGDTNTITPGGKEYNNTW